MKRFIVATATLALFLFAGTEALAASLGEIQNFNIDKGYDLNARSSDQAVLILSTTKLYYYADTAWWNGLDGITKESVRLNLGNLSLEFENKTYPKLTEVFGQEWNPGIDKDERITILLHPMKDEVGGYFNSADEYPKTQVPVSNEREMIYLNTKFIDKTQTKYFLAHEFIHLVSFNQKERILGVSDDVWLNEARAEYSSTLLGYDDVYEGSNLQRRIRNFLDKPIDSLTEWQNKSYDYGVLNIFTQYLVDNYGIEVLTDSLKSRKTGIDSINEVLSKKGYIDDFSQIFTNWTVAVIVNNCDLGPKYCYKNQNLKNFRITATPNFLPFSDQSVLSVSSSEKQWSGNWQKFVGGKGDLTLEFKGNPGTNFKVPYIVEDSLGNYTVSFLQLDSKEAGTIIVPKLGIKNVSLIIIPSVSTKTTGFSDNEPTYQFSWTASTAENSTNQEAEIVKQLLARIDELKKEIASLQAQIAARQNNNQGLVCGKFQDDLYFGMQQNQEVKCLQSFLKVQGEEIYPEGLITGNFLNATKSAAIRFQQKYALEILAPVGLQVGNGFVGPKTRAKINQLIGD